MPDYTIHAFFNAEMIVGVLNAVVMLVGSGGTGGDYLGLVRVAAMLGIFVATATGFAKARGEDAAHYVIMVAIFYSTLLVPRVTVTIQDHGSAGGGYGAGLSTVANVPIGLAFFASATSQIGYWLTNTAETFYTLPDASLRLGQGGMMAGSRALRESAGASIVDPILAQDMTSFMRDCINPEIVASPVVMSAILRSKNLLDDFTTFSLVNPGRMVTLASLGLKDCAQAFTSLKTRMAPEATSALGRIAKTISPSVTDAQALTYMTALLPASEALIMTASASAADAIKQRMMVNVLNDTGKTIGQLMNDPSAVQAGLGEAIAAQSANTSYRVMAKMAQESLPVIRNAVELVIIGVFPIMLIVIIIAGSKGGAVLKSYVMMMLWVQLWAPIYAIINYIGTMQSAKSMRGSLAGVDGVAIDNAAALLNTTLSGEAITGLLCISVPMIALALVKGGEMAATGMVSGLMSPGSSAAQSAGAQAGTGNVSMGNTSWGNYTANNSGSNKTDNAPSMTDQGGYTLNTPNGTAKLNRDGSVASATASGFTSAATVTTGTGAKQDRIQSDGLIGGDGRTILGQKGLTTTGFTGNQAAYAISGMGQQNRNLISAALASIDKSSGVGAEYASTAQTFSQVAASLSQNIGSSNIANALRSVGVNSGGGLPGVKGAETVPTQGQLAEGVGKFQQQAANADAVLSNPMSTAQERSAATAAKTSALSNIQNANKVGALAKVAGAALALAGVDSGRTTNAGQKLTTQDAGKVTEALGILESVRSGSQGTDGHTSSQGLVNTTSGGTQTQITGGTTTSRAATLLHTSEEAIRQTLSSGNSMNVDQGQKIFEKAMVQSGGNLDQALTSVNNPGSAGRLAREVYNDTNPVGGFQGSTPNETFKSGSKHAQQFGAEGAAEAQNFGAASDGNVVKKANTDGVTLDRVSYNGNGADSEQGDGLKAEMGDKSEAQKMDIAGAKYLNSARAEANNPTGLLRMAFGQNPQGPEEHARIISDAKDDYKKHGQSGSSEPYHGKYAGVISAMKSYDLGNKDNASFSNLHNEIENVRNPQAPGSGGKGPFALPEW